MHVMIPLHDAHPKDVATKVLVKQLSKVSARVNITYEYVCIYVCVSTGLM